MRLGSTINAFAQVAIDNWPQIFFWPTEEVGLCITVNTSCYTCINTVSMCKYVQAQRISYLSI